MFQASWDVLKGKSALMIFERYENLKYKYGNSKIRSNIQIQINIYDQFTTDLRPFIMKCKEY